MYKRQIQIDLLQIFILLITRSDHNYLVGGCVRDILTGGIPDDYDIVTDIPMPDLKKVFAEAGGWKVKETGENFLVLNASRGGRNYEIANFRKEGVYLDGRRPEKVEIGTIEEDAARRDFTVNAMYLEPFTWEFIDPLGKGKSDVETRTLRFIGKAKDRIREDYLRVFRFYRFLRKGYRPDPKSLRACRELFDEAYAKTTPERVRVEVEKMAGLVS